MVRPVTKFVAHLMTRGPLVTVVALVFVLAACGSADQVDAGDGDTGSGGDDNSTMASPAGTWILTRAEIDDVVLDLPTNEDGSPRPLELEIESGAIGGDGGCNQFGGTIDLANDGSATVSDLFATEMACMPMEILDFESTYVAAVASTTAWAVDPTGLMLSSETATLRYEQAPPVEHAQLLGTTWELDSIYMGEGVGRAVSSADMSASPATLLLDEQSATLTSDDCDPIVFEISLEPGAEGSFSVLDQGDGVACENPNVVAARGGLVDATGYMVFEQRLTFIGLPGETVGFIAR